MAEMITGAREFVELAPPSPLGGGVVSVARVIDTSGHELMGAQAITDACATAEEWDEWCTVTPAGTKLFDDDLDLIEGDPFALYAGVACDLQRIDDAAERAARRLDFAESRGIDMRLAAQLAADVNVIDLGGPMGVVEAIGAAEGFAATVYGGVPTILIPRYAMQCGCGNGALKANLDGTLMTCAGSRVAPVTTPVTVPFPDPMPATNLYVTGQITIFRSPVNTISVPQQVFDDGTFAPARALAERVYVPVFDCLVAKVEVTCS